LAARHPLSPHNGPLLDPNIAPIKNHLLRKCHTAAWLLQMI
jgi:hypothetical protein